MIISEDYVSYETAKLLKEKGFKQWCRHCYGVDVRHKGKSISFDEECELKDEGFGNEIEYVEGGQFHICGYGNDTEDNLYAAPTLQMAMKWLRKVHNLHCDIGYDDLDWFWNVLNVSESVPVEERPMMIKNGFAGFKSYEEAAEAAIKYCLENLI